MGWFNYYGLAAVIIVILPTVLCTVFDKSVFEIKFKNKPLEIIEQVGRYGCMAFMVFNVPYTYFGFWFENALPIYLAVGGAMLVFYSLGWAIFRKVKSKVKMLWLSVTPTALFLFCGITVSSVPLIVCAVLFGIGHITISYKNAENSEG